MSKRLRSNSTGNELSSPLFRPLKPGRSEYQNHARDCRKMATRTHDSTHKEQLEELARAWLSLAEARLKQLERKLRLGNWLRLTR
jgi:hypothetical protein